MKAVIPAAGLGTRFLPYTRSQPKEMLPVVDKPAIQYVVEEASESGIHEILIVTARGKRAIEDHFDRNMDYETRVSQVGSENLRALHELLEKTRVFYVRQADHRGLGHAVLITEKFVGAEPFSVLLGDDLCVGPSPCQRSLIDIHVAKGVSVLAVQRVERDVIGRYGMVVGSEVEDGLFHIEKIVEKPRLEEATSDLATIGRYVFTPAIFRHLHGAKPDSKGEVQLTGAISSLLREEDVYAHLFTGRRYDIGNKMGWLRANIDLALERPELAEEAHKMIAEHLRHKGSEPKPDVT